jgi:hypothetical protein
MNLRERWARTPYWVALLLGYVLGLLLLFTRLAFADTAPRRILWGHTHGSGLPWLKADGTYDTTLVKQAAQLHDIVAVQVVPFADARPDCIALLKHYNPNVKVLATSTLGVCWPYAGNNFWARVWDAASNGRGLLRGSDGKLFPDSAAPWVNFADKTFMESLSELWLYGPLAAPGIDGVLMDYAGATASWAHNAQGYAIDCHAAGFPTLAAMDSARTANLRTFLSRIRSVYPQALILGNGVEADAQSRGLWDGDVLEGWPYFRGGFNASMKAYWADPPMTMVKMEGGAPNPYTPEEMRRYRFGLGCAALGSGYFNYYPVDAALEVEPRQERWIGDDDSVWPWPARRTDLSGAHRGWMGKDANPATFVRDSSTLAFKADTLSGVWRRDFPNGMVLVNGHTARHYVPLGAPLWFPIYGVRDPAHDHGGDAQLGYWVEPNDALFLMRKPYVRPSGARKR